MGKTQLKTQLLMGLKKKRADCSALFFFKILFIIKIRMLNVNY